MPSNTIGQQFWCIIGARNSYVKAAQAGGWQGFECPSEWEKTSIMPEIESNLNNTFSLLLNFIESTNSLTEVQEDYLFDLLEHELQHHGQLIRYIYGLKVGAPQSWKDRYNLD